MSNLSFVNNLNPSQVVENAPEPNYDVLPKGSYNAMIHSAEVVDTNAGNGKMVKIRLDITGHVDDGSGAGRVVFDQIILQHPSERAVEIGRERFSRLCVACGFETRAPSDTRELVGKAVECYLKVEKGGVNPKTQEKYDDQNRVASYTKPSGSAPGATSAIPDFANDDDIPF